MSNGLTSDQLSRYRDDGYLFPLSAMSASEARECRTALEAVEAKTAAPEAIAALRRAIAIDKAILYSDAEDTAPTFPPT